MSACRRPIACWQLPSFRTARERRRRETAPDRRAARGSRGDRSAWLSPPVPRRSSGQQPAALAEPPGGDAVAGGELLDGGARRWLGADQVAGVEGDAEPPALADEGLAAHRRRDG